jgi:hypothetical protein
LLENNYNYVIITKERGGSMFDYMITEVIILTVILLVATGISAYTDAKNRKILNNITLPLFFTGFLYN